MSCLIALGRVLSSPVVHTSSTQETKEKGSWKSLKQTYGTPVGVFNRSSRMAAD